MGLGKATLAIGSAALLATQAACAHKDSCKELHAEYSEDSIVLASGTQECSKLLGFLQSEKFDDEGHPAPKEWISQVSMQKVLIMHRMLDALLGVGPNTGVVWEPESFAMTPATIPCEGLTLSEDAPWPLAQLGVAPPPGPLVFRTSLQVQAFDPSTGGQYATIQLFQDHNCDGVIGVNTMKGTFVRGLYPEQGGWLKDGMVKAAPLYE